MKFLQKYKSDLSGNVGMMFGVSSFAILVTMGVAIDYGQMTKAQTNLQNQVDAAVLAAVSTKIDGTNNSLDVEYNHRKNVALQVMKGNGFETQGVEPTVTITSSKTVLVEAEMDYKMAFGGLIGRDTVKLSADSESGLGTGRTVQLALVVDNTLSMLENGKMAALKTGTKNLVDSIEESGSGSEIALVPFARYVRIPTNLYSASWLDVPEEFDTEITWQQATHTGGTCRIETRTRIRDGFEQEYETNVCTDQTTTYEEMSRVMESRFEGCVGTRAEPYSEIDGSYTNKVPGLLHLIPYQHSGTYESNAWCATAITPLTENYDTVIAGINELYGTDQTYLPSGLLWGKAVLSPGAPFDNSSDDAGTEKVMVFMTDGKNSAQIQTGQAAEDAYLAPPYIATSENDDEYSPEANSATLRLCDSIKADGIQIFTIAFQVDDTETKNLLNSCASDASVSFTAENNSALIDRFDQISELLKGNVRLMR